MASVEIHIDVNKCQFELTGDAKDLWLNRRARFFLKDYLNAQLSQDDKVLIPYIKESIDDKEKVLTEIQDLLVKFSYAENLTDDSKSILSDYLEEKGKFEEFSDKARRIWNNDLDIEDFTKFTEVLKKEVPNRTLYDLQLLSSYHLAFSQNACNFSVPGAGKTSIVYGAYAYLRSLPKDNIKYVNKLLIIGPLSSFGPWEDEYYECFAENPDVQRLSGGVSKDDKIRHFLSPHSAEITLISYQGVVSSLNDIISYLRRHENKVMVVLDEAHKIKNTEGGIWAQSILSIAKYCKSRVVLTGTPAPNGYEDIYNLYNFIWPDKNIISYHLYQLKEMTGNPFDVRIPSLVDMLSPFFIRITKGDLKKYMGLPEPVENTPYYVDMGAVQREIYDFIEKNYLDYFQNLSDGKDITNTLVKARMIRLMQAGTNPALLQKPIEEYYREQGMSNELFIDDSDLIDKIIEYRQYETPAKFFKVAELVQDIIQRGEKVVIWGIFIQTIKDLQQFLKSLDIDCRLLIGETPIEFEGISNGIDTRESIVRDFNSKDSSFQVIIANPFAVAESISLHKSCHNAIYVERNFNASNFLQSKDRIHRVGLKPTDKINYYYVLARNSIDETINERLIEKEKNMLRIIESKSIPFINMNMDYESDLNDDIKHLIYDYVKRVTKDR
ncbi:ATP-dependent helicase [Pedobacter sp. LMG 31464]|uniref:ATP-dependent helicase n=1 Tax=Pedobacter planticolens TaxID=2679964 RepID=A0A923DZ04_9SPHI|nr:DEAD/DEAH box helicase [Pedobacter planticolens]MBB2144579.1 ATP-dependent helicase [Pedobacter planticolens]